jgi:hypothetical protein
MAGINPFLQPTSASFESDDDGGEDFELLDPHDPPLPAHIGTVGSVGAAATPFVAAHVVCPFPPRSGSGSAAGGALHMPPGAVTVEITRPDVATSFGFSLGCDQVSVGLCVVFVYCTVGIACSQPPPYIGHRLGELHHQSSLSSLDSPTCPDRLLRDGDACVAGECLATYSTQLN